MTFGFLNQNLDGLINFLQDSFDSRGGSSNLGINNILDLLKEVNNVVFDLTRFNLGFYSGKNVLQYLSSIHDVSDRDVFCLVPSNIVLELRKLSNDSFQKLSKNGFSRCNMTFSLFNQNRDGLINFLQDSLNSRSGSSNLGINNGLDLLQKINDIILDFTRLNLSLDSGKDILQYLSSIDEVNNRDVFDLVSTNGIFELSNLLQDSCNNRPGSNNLSLNKGTQLLQKLNHVVLDLSRFDLGLDHIKNVLQSLSSLHDISDRNILCLSNKLIGKISKMLANGRNKILNGILQSRLQDIIKEIIKNAVTSNAVLEFSNPGNNSV